MISTEAVVRTNIVESKEEIAARDFEKISTWLSNLFEKMQNNQFDIISLLKGEVLKQPKIDEFLKSHELAVDSAEAKVIEMIKTQLDYVRSVGIESVYEGLIRDETEVTKKINKIKLTAICIGATVLVSAILTVGDLILHWSRPDVYSAANLVGNTVEAAMIAAAAGVLAEAMNLLFTPGVVRGDAIGNPQMILDAYIERTAHSIMDKDSLKTHILALVDDIQDDNKTENESVTDALPFDEV